MLGGGMRQAGFLAASGIIALTSMIQRLSEDHENAKLLAEGLKPIKGIQINMDNVQSNILMVDIVSSNYTSYTLVDKLKENGILASDINSSRIRFVTHKYISKDDINHTISVIKRIFE